MATARSETLHPLKQSIERRMNFVVSSFEDYRLNKNLKENEATCALSRRRDPDETPADSTKVDGKTPHAR